MSLGDNLGPHDGTSLLERGLNNLLGGAGRAFVKSAGNAGADDIHARAPSAPAPRSTSASTSRPATTRPTRSTCGTEAATPSAYR